MPCCNGEGHGAAHTGAVMKRVAAADQATIPKNTHMQQGNQVNCLQVGPMLYYTCFPELLTTLRLYVANLSAVEDTACNGVGREDIVRFLGESRWVFLSNRVSLFESEFIIYEGLASETGRCESEVVGFVPRIFAPCLSCSSLYLTSFSQTNADPTT